MTTTTRSDDLDGRMTQAAGTPGDNDQTDGNGTDDHASPTVPVVPPGASWYYSHVSTP